ncbi:leucine-rich repeat protein [Bacteroides ihuae]|uniref:leucine-rich repeat protein n=1 Tax=Bacteroides ihuae TaxID=1852362 RepID=UPI0008D8F6C5|nr:leucine-rich repeat protein [Bacteroides ihuae]
MNKYIVLATVCLGVLFTSCRQDVIEPDNLSSNALRIRAQIGDSFGVTRSIPTGTSEEQTQFKDGDVIGISYYDVKDKAHKKQSHYRKNGNEWVPMDGGINWIQGADLLIVDAYYPAEHTTKFDGSNQASWVEENARFVVPSDQRSTNADNDISWADHMRCREAIKKENKDKTIDLSFKRQMAKVNIRVTSLDEQWDPAKAWVSIDNLHTHRVDVRDFFPKGGEELMLNGGEATCLLPLGVWYAGNTSKFATISVYESKGLSTGKVTMELNYTPVIQAGKATTINLKIGKKRVDVEQFTIEPWGGKVAITDAVGPNIPVMIVKDGFAHIYLDRATNGTAQIADSIASAESQKHQVHDFVFYGKTAGKLTLDANNNMLRNTTIRSLDLSHVMDLTAISDKAFKVMNEAVDFTKFEELILPSSVKAIGKDAFFNNKTLKRIVTPEVEEVAENAFNNCRSLLAVSFPKLKKINNNTFEECVSMSEANFPLAEEIGEHAFKKASLSGGVSGKVNFPKVRQIYPEAFAYSSLTGGAFIGGDGEIKTGLNVKNVLVFPEVIQIDTRAFLGCSGLIAISFPKAIRFHDYLFSGCSSLAALKITAKGEMKYIGADVTPFGRDFKNYPASHAGEDYNPARNDPWRFGVGTLYVHTDKMLNPKNKLSFQVTEYVHYIGYGDNRGQAKFGGRWWPNNTAWQELVYVDDNGKETWAHLIH